jgi:serine/threonine-protein kinase
MLVKHINDEPDPPSLHAKSAIPPALDALVLDCLRKRNEDRPPSAEDLDARLATIDLVSGWTQERARAWWDQNQPSWESREFYQPEVQPESDTF